MYRNDFNNLDFSERSKIYDREYDLFDEEMTWNSIWKRAEKRVWNKGALIATIGICIGLFILLLIGSAGIFAVTENLLLKLVAGFVEVWIVIGIAFAIALLYVRAAMPKCVAPLYDTYLKRHRERSAITRQIIRATEELREELKENILRKEAKET